jgi:hypothetical protein
MSSVSSRPVSLFAAEQATYGDSYRGHLLEQYKIYVESASKISERRTSANNYLITVNGFLITLYGLAASSPLAGKGRPWQYAVPFAGILICLAWLSLIKAYRDLNTAKFAVIHEIEARLPLALFGYEWHIADRGKSARYRPLTHIEPAIPWTFMGLYLFLAVLVISGD